MSGTFLAVPGQGSQSLGMGRQLATRHSAARAVFDEAADALGFDLRDVMWGDSASRLMATDHAQPAIVLLAIAALRAWEASTSSALDIRWAVGHSVGSIAAAIAAGALAFADGMRLARTRGLVMSAAPGPGAMLAVAVTSPHAHEDIARVAAALGLDIACINGPRQIVLAGPRAGILEARTTFGARSRLLDVSHGFHSSLMDPVAQRWAREVATTPFRDPRVPLLSAISGELLHTAEHIAEDVRRGVRETVRWDLVTAVAHDIGCSAVILGNGHTLIRFWRGDAIADGAIVVDDGFRGGVRAA